MLSRCLQWFWSHRAAGALESGDFYGHDLEKQLNRELKMEERLRHTPEQDKNVLVRGLELFIEHFKAKTIMQQ